MSKPESTLDDSTIFDDQDADHGMEYMEIKEVVDEGRQRNAEELVSTARLEVSTARPDIDAARKSREKSKPESTLDDSTVFDDQDADHGI
ncbi:hypothetical protein Tco_1270344, partial [Tanacetum coccineum]